MVDGLRESGIGGKILSDALTLGGTRRGEEQGRRAMMDWEGPLTLEVLQVRKSGNNNSKEQQQYRRNFSSGVDNIAAAAEAGPSPWGKKLDQPN